MPNPLGCILPLGRIGQTAMTELSQSEVATNGNKENNGVHRAKQFFSAMFFALTNTASDA